MGKDDETDSQLDSTFESKIDETVTETENDAATEGSQQQQQQRTRRAGTAVMVKGFGRGLSKKSSSKASTNHQEETTTSNAAASTRRTSSNPGGSNLTFKGLQGRRSTSGATVAGAVAVVPDDPERGTRTYRDKGIKHGAMKPDVGTIDKATPTTNQAVEIPSEQVGDILDDNSNVSRAKGLHRPRQETSRLRMAVSASGRTDSDQRDITNTAEALDGPKSVEFITQHGQDQAEEETEEFSPQTNGTVVAAAVSNDGLAVANPVSDEDLEDIPEAQEWDESKKKIDDGNLKAKLQVLAACFVVLVVLVLVLVFSLTEEDASTSSLKATGPTPAPSISMEGYVLSLVPEYTVEAILEEIGQDGEPSPQSRAFEWLVNDPSLLLYSNDQILQRLALASFFYSTGGGWRNATNWLSYDHHECDWFAQPDSGFYADLLRRTDLLYNETGGPCGDVDSDELQDSLALTEFRGYQHLWLYNNKLEGTIPVELYWLTSLRSISLIANKLTGTVSSHIGLLTRLEAFAPFFNQLSGEIPTEIGLLSNSLEGLAISYNKFDSTIPTQVGDLASLEILIMEYLPLHGELPSELGRLSDRLRWFFGAQNRALTGTIPTELGNLKAMEDMRLDGNQFHGKPTLLCLSYGVFLFTSSAFGQAQSQLNLLAFLLFRNSP